MIEDVALSNPDVIYIDQEEFIRKEGKNFDDVCHLSFDACQEFIDHLVAGLGDFLQRSEGF